MINTGQLFTIVSCRTGWQDQGNQLSMNNDKVLFKNILIWQIKMLIFYRIYNLFFCLKNNHSTKDLLSDDFAVFFIILKVGYFISYLYLKFCPLIFQGISKDLFTKHSLTSFKTFKMSFTDCWTVSETSWNCNMQTCRRNQLMVNISLSD